MAKIKVDLSASYGYGCSGCGYGSDETQEIEVSDLELEALAKIGTKEISCEAVVAAIENGETALKALHEKLEEAFYNMVEKYWLFEADNECLYESLGNAIEDDISEGLYTPEESSEDEDIDDEEYEDEDEYDEERYDLDKYYEWVCSHDDHEFIAERVGLDLDACRDDEVNYTITLV